MKIEINFAFCALVVLTGSSQTKGQNSPTTTTLSAVDHSSEAGASASSVPPTDAAELEHDSDDPSYQTSSEYQDGTTAISIVVTSSHVIGQSQTDTADRNGTTSTTRMSTAAHTDDTVKTTPSVFSLSDSPASASMPPDVETSTPLQYISTPPDVETSTPLQYISTPPDVETSTPLQYISTPDSSNTPAGTGLLHTTSAPPSLIPPPLDVATLQPSTHASTEAPPTQTNTHPPTTSQPQASAPAYPPASQPRQEVPSELNVGDEDFKGPRHRHSSPLDPLLAGLVSVFIVTTAIISVVLFLKFRQRTDHPEFHRLQDLPMDDLLEDTPLSRYSY